MADPRLPPPRLSVIIPLGPGEREATGLLHDLLALAPASEIILVHADPEPYPLPPHWPARLPVLQRRAAGGRAKQLNVGARQAAGVWLWFLHADTRLLPGCLDALQGFIDRPGPALGWFDLKFRGDGPWLVRLNAHGANLRARWLGIPFGDQGFVLRAELFACLGGYDETASYGEDHLFVWTARCAGVPPRRIPGTVATSARKYARRGWARTTLVHWALTAAQAWPAWRRLRRMPKQR